MEFRAYSSYKDSGLPWLDKIPSHWEEKRGKYYFREIDERSVSGDEQLMSVSHVTGVTPRKASVTMFMAESNAGYKMCRPGDIVINTMWAWMAALGVSRQVGLVSPSYGVYRPLKNNFYLNEYLDNLIRIQPYASEYICRSTGIRSSRLRLYPDDFLDIRIVRPPVQEQEMIVNFINHYNNVIRRFIRNRQKLIKVLNEQKQAIINQAVTRGLNPDVRFKPSGVDWIGEIPEHWRICRLRNVISNVTSGSRGWSSFAADEGPLFIRIANLKRMSLDLRFDDVVRLKLPETSEAKRTMLCQDDLLISITAFIGSIAVVPNNLGEAYVSQHVARCSMRKQQNNSRWIGYVLLSQIGQTHGRMRLYGGTKDGLSLDDVKNYPILLPPRFEQDEIVKHIEQNLADIDFAIKKTEQEILIMREFSARLIADVVTGKVDVRHLAPSEAEMEVGIFEGGTLKADTDDAEMAMDDLMALDEGIEEE